MEADLQISEAVRSSERRVVNADGDSTASGAALPEQNLPINTALESHTATGIDAQELTHLQHFANEIRLRRLTLETEITKCALFTGYALMQLSTNLLKAGRSAEFLKHFEDFKERHFGFDVPSILYGLNLMAESGAKQIHNLPAQKTYCKAKERFEKQAFEFETSNGSIRLTLEAQKEAYHFERVDYSSDPRQLLNNAVNRMLEWATIEMTKGCLTSVGVCKLFQEVELSQELDPSVSSRPQSDEDFYVLDPHKLAIKMYGPDLEPTRRDVWLSYFEPIEEWLRSECKVCSEERRHWILKILQQSRCNTLRHCLLHLSSEVEHTKEYWYELLYKEILEYGRILRSIHEGATKFERVGEIERATLESIYNLSSSKDAIRNGRVTDSMLCRHTDVLGQHLCDIYPRTENLRPLYYILSERALIAHRRYIFFQTVEPGEALKYLEEADLVYSDLRKKAAASQFQKAFDAKSFQLKFQVVQELRHHRIYTTALCNSLLAYFKTRDSPPNHQTGNGVSVRSQLEVLSLWLERSKARNLLDELGIGTRLPKRLLAAVDARSQYQEALSRENEYILQFKTAEEAGLYAEETRLQNEISALRAKMLSDSTLREVMNIREGHSVTLTEIAEMLDRFEPGTTLVSYAHIIGQESSNLWIIHYRRGMQPVVRPTLRVEQVNDWISHNLEVDEPLLNKVSESKLDEMNPLVEYLGEITEPGDRVELCPTQALHRIPLHALRVSGQILVERNPVIYTQSLSILRQCHLTSEAIGGENKVESKTTIISPLQNSWQAPLTTYHGVESSKHTIMHCGDFVPKEVALDAMHGASIFAFHGHATFFSKKRTLALEQYLDLGMEQPPLNEYSETGKITAEQIFGISLHPAALAILIGCRSGRMQVSLENDLLGLPTALFYAGATSVISTLWKIDNEDGIAFMKAFFRALVQLKESCGDGMLDLSLVMQRAVSALRESDELGSGENSPYRWAAFTLNGFWEIPSAFVS